MLSYDLSGKQVILVLEKAFVDRLAPLGVGGSPLLGQVYSVEEEGLWLDATRFPLCPVGAPRLYDAKGVSFCHAHVFIPRQAVVSVVAFPQAVGELQESEDWHRIGFQPKPKKR